MWPGTLWVSPRGATSWRQNITEPADSTCGPTGYYGDSSEWSVQLQSINSSGGGDGGLISVTARWSRRVDQPCGGLWAVEVRDAIRVTEAQTATLEGDGGFVIELPRR